MKKIYLFLALSFSTLFSFSQQYLNETCVWHYRGGAWDGVNMWDYHRYYYFDGDTIVDDLTYYKMQFLFLDTMTTWQNEEVPIVYDPIPLQMVREEDGRFYMRSLGALEENLLFDFNIYQQGDTVAYSDLYCPNDVVVTSIDTVYLGTELRQRYFVNDLNMHYVVEGVGGGQNGLSLECPGMLPIEGGPYFSCFFKNGYSINMSFLWVTDECASMPATIENEIFTPEIVIFPNPAQTKCTFLNLAPDAVVTITDQGGKTYPLEMTQRNADISSLATGIYVLTIQSGNSTVHRRLVKMD